MCPSVCPNACPVHCIHCRYIDAEGVRLIDRRQDLLAYGFRCACSRCVLEEEEAAAAAEAEGKGLTVTDS
jgi:hypothetical protein